MSHDKPTKSEEEYIAKEEAEQIKRMKKKQADEALIQKREETKAICFMKCPKCGDDLKQMLFRGINIDRCTNCEGVWLDQGELDKLAGSEDKSIIGDILNMFKD